MQYTNELTTVETIEVSKKVGNKREKVGEVSVPVPTLADIGLQDDGSLVAQWVAKALRAAALTDARNKLVSGTADLKAGAKIAATLDELAAPAENSGAALKEIGEIKRKFAAYLQGLGLSAKAQAFLNGIMASPKSAALQPPEILAKVAERIEGFLEASDEEPTPAQERYLTAIIEATGDDEELDLNDL